MLVSNKMYTLDFHFLLVLEALLFITQVKQMKQMIRNPTESNPPSPPVQYSKSFLIKGISDKFCEESCVQWNGIQGCSSTVRKWYEVVHNTQSWTQWSRTENNNGWIWSTHFAHITNIHSKSRSSRNGRYFSNLLFLIFEHVDIKTFINNQFKQLKIERAKEISDIKATVRFTGEITANLGKRNILEKLDSVLRKAHPAESKQYLQSSAFLKSVRTHCAPSIKRLITQSIADYHHLSSTTVHTCSDHQLEYTLLTNPPDPYFDMVRYIKSQESPYFTICEDDTLRLRIEQEWSD